MNNELFSMFADTCNDMQNTSNNPLLEALPAMIPGLLTTLLGDPEMMGETLRNIITKYKPALYALLEELFTCYEDLANNQRVFKAQAQMKWNAYASYLNEGFTPEQAMLLMIDSDAARKSFTRQIPSSIFTAGSDS